MNMEKLESEGSPQVGVDHQSLGGQSEWELRLTKVKAKLEKELSEAKKKNELREELKKLMNEIRVERSKNSFITRFLKRFKREDQF